MTKHTLNILGVIKRDENYLKFASVCPHLADVIVD